MAEENNSRGNSLGMFAILAVLLTVLFVALKLLGVIAWNWWAVFAPVIAYMLGSALVVAVVLLVAVVIGCRKK